MACLTSHKDDATTRSQSSQFRCHASSMYDKSRRSPLVCWRLDLSNLPAQGTRSTDTSTYPSTRRYFMHARVWQAAWSALTSCLVAALFLCVSLGSVFAAGPVLLGDQTIRSSRD